MGEEGLPHSCGGPHLFGRKGFVRRTAWVAAPAFPLLAALLGGCSESPPIVGGDDLFPVQPLTVEWVLPFDRFASDVRVVGGFGNPADVGVGLLTRSEGFESRTLLRFSGFPSSATLPDSLGVTRTDTNLTFIGGELLLRFDSVRYAPAAAGPIPVRLHRLESGAWDPQTATWALAVDTLGGARPWPQPGAGGGRLIAEGRWDRAAGDSLIIPVDSATIAAWGDTTQVGRGARLDAGADGVRLRVQSAALRLRTKASINRDTILALPVPTERLTFIYDPLPAPPTGELRVGGAPAWRTFFRVSLPPRIEAPDPLCAQVTCPLELKPNQVVYAAVVLRSRAAPGPFQPVDSLSVDVRPVLDPDRFPRSPLGESFIPFGQRVAADWFGVNAGRPVSVPVTGLVRDLVRGETLSGETPARAVALLAPLEPLSFEFTPFEGPGTAGAPSLRILLTLLDGVRLP